MQYIWRTDKNVRILAMAPAPRTDAPTRTATPIRGEPFASRLLAGEAEERYITRPDKPVQRNILEIRSAIIYCRALFFVARPPFRHVDARFLHVAQRARPASRCGREKTQLRGQTAEVGGRKRMKNARGRRRTGRTRAR